MGKQAFALDLTEKQKRALILSEFLPFPDIIRLILIFTREQEFLDAQAEHLDLRDVKNYASTTPITFPVPIPTIEWRAMKFHVCIDIQCFHPGFMMLFVPPEHLEAGGWFPHIGPNLSLKDIPGMREMPIKDKIKLMKIHIQDSRDIVENSLYHYNLGIRGSTDEGDYGGVYYETDTPELGVTATDGQTNGRFVIL
tara:strand:+ start:238 stop:825 length:588 start_codon:yes stop_codon:yes gene_type:complete